MLPSEASLACGIAQHVDCLLGYVFVSVVAKLEQQIKMLLGGYGLADVFFARDRHVAQTPEYIRLDRSREGLLGEPSVQSINKIILTDCVKALVISRAHECHDLRDRLYD